MEPAHRGFHKTSLVGPVGAAIAAGVVMKLTLRSSVRGRPCVLDRLGHQELRGRHGGGMMKRMHAGRAAESGVRMAQFAARGFTGPPTAIDGRFGMLEVFGGKTARPELLTKRLGEHWAIENVYVKVFPCCSWIQASVQQLVALRGDQPLQPHAIKHVRIATNSYGEAHQWRDAAGRHDGRTIQPALLRGARIDCRSFRSGHVHGRCNQRALAT